MGSGSSVGRADGRPALAGWTTASVAAMTWINRPDEGMLKFADYQADGFATDTTKLWLQFAATF